MMEHISYKISFIGAGNIAFRMGIALQNSGHQIVCICNKTLDRAEKVARAIKRHGGSPITTDNINLIPDSDLIIIAVSDSAIAEIASKLSGCKTPVVHTSGAESIETLKDSNLNSYGVFYPLMTMSENKDIDIRMVPFLIEAVNDKLLQVLINIVNSLKAEYLVCNSQKRLQMHTAAVFSTNFINYILGLAYEVSYPDFTFLLPSAIESVRKAFLNTPKSSQTGPAHRGDIKTLEKHIAHLKERGLDEHLKIYKELSEGIGKRAHKNNSKDSQNNTI